MPAFPSLFRSKLLLLAALLLAEDKPVADRQRLESRDQRPTIRTTTRDLTDLPTFSAVDGTISTALWRRRKLVQNPPASPAMQPGPQRNAGSEIGQCETAPKTATSEENQQPPNPQPANSENSPRNPPASHSPASAKTAPQDQDDAVGQGQSLVNVLCASCHSTMLVNNARKTRGDWRKTLSKMEKQGMPKLPPSLREPLIQYLATALGLSNGNLRQNYGPWASLRNVNPLW